MSCLRNFADCLQTLKRRLLNQAADWQGGDRRRESQHQRGSRGIPLARKMCYAVGGVPYQITAIAMSVSLQIFLLDVVQMEAFYVSMILFVSRAWDAVTDPLVGYLVSRGRWTPIGKLIPWVVLSMPFAVLSYVLLWFVPRGPMSQAFSVPWFLAAACLFETLMSCYHVPYLSLNMFLGGNQRDRDSATAYRMGVEMLAMLLASVIQGQVVAVYNIEKEGACQQLDQANGVPQITPSPHTAPLQATRKAFLTSALVMAALFFLCSLVLFLGVKEQKAPPCSHEKVQVSYLSSLKMLACHIPYQRLVLGFVFSALAFQMSLGNFALFCTHAAGLGAQFQHLLLALLVAASIAVPFWQAVLVRIGKKPTVVIGLSLFIPAVLIIACVPSNLPVFMMMCILIGFSVATLFLLPWSMLPDVVDDFAVRNPSCKDLEPLFFSCYAFCNKLGGGLSVGISTMALHFVGYRAGVCNHGDGVVTALIVLFSPVPIALLLVGMVFFLYYPINEKQCLQLTTVHPEATSSSERGENTGQPTNLQQPQSSAKSSVKSSLNSHHNTRTSALHKSNSLPCCYNHNNKKNSVNANGLSNKSECPSEEYSGPRSVARANVMLNLECQKQTLDSYQHPPKAKWSNSSSENTLCPFSKRSNVKSKVTWV